MRIRKAVLATLCGSFVASAAEAQVEWRSASDAPVDYSPAMAFDSVNSAVLSVGPGPGLGGATSFTTMWRNSRWGLVQTTGSPTNRAHHAIASDPRRQRIVLFGGMSGLRTTRLDDTWEWDGRTWSQIRPATVPPLRSSHAMAYDPARGVVVMFGGFDGRGFLGDTWEWNGVDWRQRTPAVSPSPRSGHAMAFDPASGGVLLFGGGDDELWVFSGAPNASWRRFTPGAGPSTRREHRMVYDGARQRIVLHGGQTSSRSDPLDDTWEWNGTAWTLRARGGTPRFGEHGMAFDVARGVTVSFGGLDPNAAVLSGTYEWNGTSWTDMQTSSPGGRLDAAMTFDSARGVAILFGGIRTGHENDTWTLDGSRWTEQKPTTSPPPRRGQVLAYMPGRQRAVLFGGYGGTLLGDTWEWDGRNWAQASPTVNLPARWGHALAADDVRGRVVLFSGLDQANTLRSATWEWDGKDWLRGARTGPPERMWHAMAFDRARRVTILFGGYRKGTHLDDTWSWDGSTWRQFSPANSPPARREHVLVYDSYRQRIVLIGGQNNSGMLSDVWEWDGADWTQRRPQTSLGVRYGVTVAYDDARRRVLAYGGTAPAIPSVTPPFQLWEYVPTDPAAFVEYGIGCSGGPINAPRLTSDRFSLPWIGDTFTQRVTNAPTNAGIALILGLSDRTWNNLPLPLDLAVLGMPGCFLYTSYDLVLGLPNRGGTASLDLAIPASATLVGANLFGQAAVTAPGANALGLLSSNGTRMTVGSR